MRTIINYFHAIFTSKVTPFDIIAFFWIWSSPSLQIKLMVLGVYMILLIIGTIIYNLFGGEEKNKEIQ